eukprot:evm.model.scf_365.6 EVM.evm.TU.scf_365.6   scf_365:84771-96127(-)
MTSMQSGLPCVGAATRPRGLPRPQATGPASRPAPRFRARPRNAPPAPPWAPPLGRGAQRADGRRGDWIRRCAGGQAMMAEDPMPDGDGAWRWRARTMGRILAFAVPALAIPLADPLLSVVDAVIIAQYAGTYQLAALGPNTAIFGFVNYIFNSLGLATISIVAKKVNEEGDGSRALSTSLFVALVGGLTSTLALQLSAQWLIASSGVAPAVAGPALNYLHIRALAQPASLCVLVCQAGLLAQKDSRTPVATVALGGLFDLIGDWILVAHFSMGLTGAALATFAAEILEIAVMWAVLRRRGRAKPSLILPTIGDLRATLSVLLPLSVVYVCKNLCYVMVQWTAAGLETLKVAAHQAMYSWWTLFAFAHAPVEHSALSFIPSARGNREWLELTAMILVFGLSVGCLGGAIAAGVPSTLPQIFTPDDRLWPLMRSLALPAFSSMLLVGADVGATSVLYAAGDAAYIARAMAMNLLAMAAYFWAVVRCGWGLRGVWGGLVFFFSMRVVWSVPRLWGRHVAARLRRSMAS